MYLCMYVYIHIYIYIFVSFAYTFIYIYIYIGGWGVSPTGKSYSFRSCVRACERARRGEAVCGRETRFLPTGGCGSAQRAPGVWFRRGVPALPYDLAIGCCQLSQMISPNRVLSMRMSV